MLYASLLFQGAAQQILTSPYDLTYDANQRHLFYLVLFYPDPV